MAEKRMFTKKITESDAFLNMPLSAQALYFHLNMAADDEGFVNNPMKIQRAVGAAIDDLNLLVAKNFIIKYESGIIVIKHWKMHNYIAKDRFHPTDYSEERAMLEVKKNGAYTLVKNEPYTECIQDVYADKNRLDKTSIDKDILSGRPDVASEIIEYLNSKTGKKFTAKNKSTQRLINARLSEGRTVEDFKTVIDKKVKAWKKNPEMNQYLRPETLFAASHFESYLNESEVQPQGKYGSMMQNDINFDELEKKLLT